MDSNQSEQQYYLSKLSSNIISPAQYPCTVIGSNKNNIHTIVPNNITSNSPLSNNNVKYQNNSIQDSKLAQNLSYNCYSNMANCSFNIANQNEDIKFLFAGSKPKKMHHNKRVKVVNQCLHNDNGSDITAAPNQLTILVQKVLPAQVPDHHISAQPPLPPQPQPQSSPVQSSVVTAPLTSNIISSSTPILIDPSIDSVSTIINEVLAKATSNDPHDDVFLSVLKSHCDPSAASSPPQPDNHRSSLSPSLFDDDHLAAHSNKRRHQSNSVKSTTVVKRQKLSDPDSHNQIQSNQQCYQQQRCCQLAAPVFRKLVHEPPLSDHHHHGSGSSTIVLPPIGICARNGKLCHDRRQLEHNSVKYRRPPFSLSLPRRFRVDNGDDEDDRFIVQNLNCNLPRSSLLIATRCNNSNGAGADCDDSLLVAPSPGVNIGCSQGDLDYLSVFNTVPPVIDVGPALDMLSAVPGGCVRAPSPLLALFHCPNRDYLSTAASTSTSTTSTSTINAGKEGAGSLLVDSETGEAVARDTAMTACGGSELPLYSEKVYKSSSLVSLCRQQQQREKEREEEALLVSKRPQSRPDNVAALRYCSYRPMATTAQHSNDNGDDRVSETEIAHLSMFRGAVMRRRGLVDTRVCVHCGCCGDENEEDKGALVLVWGGRSWMHRLCADLSTSKSDDSDDNVDIRVPLRHGSLALLSLGDPPLHIGFRARRIHWSPSSSQTRCAYLCQVLPGPRYSVTALDNGDDGLASPSPLPPPPSSSSSCADSCTEAWAPFLARIARLQHAFSPLHINCDKLFGLTEPVVMRALCHCASGSARTEPYRGRGAHGGAPVSPSLYNTTIPTGLYRSSPITAQRWQRLQSEWHTNVSVHRSTLVATRDIDKGTVLLEHVGELVRNEVARLRARQYRRRRLGGLLDVLAPVLGGRQLRLDEETVVDGTRRGGGLARYLSHDRDGTNCVPEALSVCGEVHLVMVAARKIDRGERLCCCCYDVGPVTPLATATAAAAAAPEVDDDHHQPVAPPASTL